MVGDVAEAYGYLRRFVLAHMRQANLKQDHVDREVAEAQLEIVSYGRLVQSVSVWMACEAAACIRVSHVHDYLNKRTSQL
jgi:glutamine synthetase